MHKLILYIIYGISKALTLLSFNTYYSKHLYKNKSHFKAVKGPYILLSNHPSTLMDPFGVAKEVPRMVYFLANASLMRVPVVGWILGSLYGIPIERPQDVKGQKIDNT